jgi:hypothetical protein
MKITLNQNDMDLINVIMADNIDIEIVNVYKNRNGYKKCKEETECSICIDTIKLTEYERSLGCLHKFHKKCIDKWKKTMDTCPVCRSIE